VGCENVILETAAEQCSVFMAQTVTKIFVSKPDFNFCSEIRIILSD
jgi:hypothetical protein